MNHYIKSMMDMCLSFADISCLNKEEIIRQLPPTYVFDNKDTETQGFIFPKMAYPYGTNQLFIVFRGTECKIKDWLTDLNGFQTVVPYNNDSSPIRVHKGFIEAYKSVRTNIHEYLNYNKNKICNVICAGHSLGGALATLCAVDINYNYNDIPIEVYTAGSPMIGNKAFVESYNKRLFNSTRAYLYSDIVPKCPPSWLQVISGKYEHVNHGLPLGPKDIFLGLKLWIFSRFKSARLTTDLANHSIDLYKKYLNIAYDAVY